MASFTTTGRASKASGYITPGQIGFDSLDVQSGAATTTGEIVDLADATEVQILLRFDVTGGSASGGPSFTLEWQPVDGDNANIGPRWVIGVKTGDTLTDLDWYITHAPGVTQVLVGAGMAAGTHAESLRAWGRGRFVLDLTVVAAGSTTSVLSAHVWHA